MLSQEEIDALLKISEAEDADDAAENRTKKNVTDYLSDIEIDTIGEIGNISFGSSATTLSTLLNQKVQITTPEVSVISKADLYSSFSFEHASIKVNFVEGFTGENVFVIHSDDAAIISDIMLGGDGTAPEEELTDIHLSAVQEAMNQMMGSAATSMSTLFNKRIDISPPSIKLVTEDNRRTGEEMTDGEVIVKVSFQIKVGELIDSKIMQLIPFPFASEMVGELMYGQAGPPEENTHQKEKPIPSETSAVTKTEETGQTPQVIGSPAGREANIQQAAFSEFDQTTLSGNKKKNLDMLLDIPLNVKVELGRTNRPIKDILELAAGSVIELDKLAGEPVDILVNDKLIAQGEVVVIDENFGVRVTDIISQTDRIMKLK